jgi:hypothetical protein
VLLVNWLGMADNPLHGDEAAEVFIASCGAALRLDLALRFEGYRIDRMQTRHSKESLLF